MSKPIVQRGCCSCVQLSTAYDEQKARAEKAEADMKIQRDLYQEMLKNTQAEVERLRGVIIEEGAKWNAHHDRPEKKRYWQQFALKATEGPVGGPSGGAQ